MLVKALTSFGGKISMGAGEVREILDEDIAKDLLRAGHVVEAKAEKEADRQAAKKAEKAKKDAAANDGPAEAEETAEPDKKK